MYLYVVHMFVKQFRQDEESSIETPKGLFNPRTRRKSSIETISRCLEILK
jgi:hypothetical protein